MPLETALMSAGRGAASAFGSQAINQGIQHLTPDQGERLIANQPAQQQNTAAMQIMQQIAQQQQMRQRRQQEMLAQMLQQSLGQNLGGF